MPCRLGCETSDCVLLAVVEAKPVPARQGVPAQTGVQVAPSAPSACVHANRVGVAASPNRVGPALLPSVGPRECCAAGTRWLRIGGGLGGRRAKQALSACLEAGAARSNSSLAARSPSRSRVFRGAGRKVNVLVLWTATSSSKRKGVLLLFLLGLWSTVRF